MVHFYFMHIIQFKESLLGYCCRFNRLSDELRSSQAFSFPRTLTASHFFRNILSSEMSVSLQTFNLFVMLLFTGT